MRTLLIISIAMLSFFSGNAQSFETSYTYDNAGNRIGRTTIILDVQEKNLSATIKEESFSDGKIIISPNPTDGKVFLSFENISFSEDACVDIFDINGRKINRIPLTENQTEIDLSGVASGNYILKLKSANATKEFLVIKK